MSQLSLLLQSKLRDLKQGKSQSQQWISEVKNHPAWEELQPKDRSEQIANLVLVTYLFTVRPGESSEKCYKRVHSLSFVLLSSDFRLLDYPEPSEVSSYRNVLICTCGNILALHNWGLLKHCAKCKGKRKPDFFVDMFQDGMARTSLVSREWAEWAQVQAILLRNKKRSQTAIVSLTSEKLND